MKLTSKEFLWIQAVIIFLLLATMDSFIRGPMDIIKEQNKDQIFLLNKFQGEYDDLRFKIGHHKHKFFNGSVRYE